MRNDPWNLVASYNGRSQSLVDCLMSWRRDARRGIGALGTIDAATPIRIDGWKSEVKQLGAAECLDLLAIMPTTYPSADIRRMGR